MYNIFKEKDNIIYSIDMLRIKTYITKTEFSYIEARFQSIWKEYIKKEYKTINTKQFLYNYVIQTDDENSFWCGFLPNSDRQGLWNENIKHNFTIEFNPNKIKNNNILLRLLSISSDWYIKSYDLALDIKINILDLFIENSGRQERKTFDYGGDNKTIILGKGNGRIKVYNKKRESNLDVGELTRVEVSRELDDYSIGDIWKFSFGDYFPVVFVNEYIFSFSDYKDKTMLAIIYAVQNGFPINELSRRYKEKLNNLMKGGYQIKFSSKVANEVMKETIRHYFNYIR